MRMTGRATATLVCVLAGGVLSGCTTVAFGGSTAPNDWWLVGATPDAQRLEVSTHFGGVASGCSRWEGWRVDETSEQVRVEALVWRRNGFTGCTDDADGRTLVVDLDEPLGSRQLVGCHRETCTAADAWPDWLATGARTAIDRTTSTVVVAGEQTSAFALDGALAWTRDDLATGWLHTSGDVAIVSEGAVTTTALDAETGQGLWEAPGGPLGMSGDRVLLCGDDGGPRLRALDARSRAPGWSVETMCGPAAVAPGSVVLVNPDLDVDGGHRLVVLDPRTGTVEVDRALDDGVDDRVAAYDAVVAQEDRIVVSGAESDLVVLAPDGTERRRFPDVRGTAVGIIGDVVVVGDHLGVAGVDLVDGQEAWRRDDLPVTALVTVGDVLLGLDGPGGQLERIDPRSGRTSWSSPVGRTATFDAVLVDGTLHVATSMAHLRLERASGAIHGWTPLPDPRVVPATSPDADTNG